MLLYDLNIISSLEIFGYLWKSSLIFGKCPKNVWKRSSFLPNYYFGKSPESGQKSSEYCQKRRH